MSTQTLAERAAALAGSRPEGLTAAAVGPFLDPDAAQHVLPAYEAGAVADGDGAYPVPEQIPAHVAWHRVMCDVRSIAKTRQTDSGAKFKFRGVEDVMLAFSGSLRRHGVIVAPIGAKTSYVSSTSKSGSAMRECDVVVTWAVIGPMGDQLPVTLETAGEAVDYSDKATTKAQSIALRTLLTTLGMVPTSDPEPEAESADIERGDPAAPTAELYFTEITNPYTPRERFRQIHNELQAHRLGSVIVEYEGVKGELSGLLMKIGAERWPARAATPPGHDHADGYSPACAACRADQVEADRSLAGDPA